jgi:phosphoribosylformylglycinamidine synthase
VTKVVVDVMLKPEILDPQGQAVLSALPRLGVRGISGVRQGKRFELDVDGDPDADMLARIEHLAATLLANPVIEDYVVRVEEGTSPAPAG